MAKIGEIFEGIWRNFDFVDPATLTCGAAVPVIFYIVKGPVHHIMNFKIISSFLKTYLLTCRLPISIKQKGEDAIGKTQGARECKADKEDCFLPFLR